MAGMFVELSDFQRTTPPDGEWVKNVCGAGKGAACCRYLTVGQHGFSCEKHSSLKAVIDERVLTMSAQADNCEGRLSV